MIHTSESIDQLSPLQRAALAVREMRARLEAIEQQQTEAIAIVGMGCRFPGGANNPELFWQRLRDGVDVTREIPSDRWNVAAYYDANPEAPGKMYTQRGGFLDHLDRFDAEFFGLMPREVVSMDPQQRLLLEVSWEALEHAGIAPDQLAGSSGGVFVGISVNEYAQPVLFNEATEIDVYAATGNALSIAAGRLSYLLGLQGPSLAIDTACSSSLVAIHQACQSLRARECRLALAGGVYLMLSPHTTIAMSKLRALSADGRCKTFDAAADGYGRGEGCGMIVLKRLSDAIADGDPILALIRGSAVNHDGRSSGLTVPNRLAQQDVIRAALTNARVEPAQVQYVEAHGTGTALGDPIEVQALKTVLLEERSQQQPLLLGSVKTNIGHLEAAAGVAGLIKVVLAMQHQEIPPHLHFKTLNPHISDLTGIQIPTQPTSWSEKNGQPRFAGVSSFGFSGTNAHVVLEEAPSKKSENRSNTARLQERSWHILTLTAKSEIALKALVQQYIDFFARYPDSSLADVCFTANTGRSHFNHRLAIVTESKLQVRQQLSSFALNESAQDVQVGQVTNLQRPKIAFLFTGQGSQYINMGYQLYETQPTFRKTIDDCDEQLRPYLEQSLLSVLYPESGTTSLLDQTAYTQPALFVLEYALAQMWRSWGIEPDIVMGHSVGEIVAACVAGVFSLEDGLKLIAERGRLMQALPEEGEMVAVFASETVVARTIAPFADQVAIAAINGLEHVVISGKREAIQTVLTALSAQGIQVRQLSVSHAFHSPLMEPMLKEFRQIASAIEYSSPRIPLISNITGKLVEANEIAQADYWCRHVLAPVQFANSMQELQKRDCEFFVEIGPNPTLINLGKRCLPNSAEHWLASLKPGQSDWQVLLHSASSLYVNGIDIHWAEVDHVPRQRLALPTYPFQRQRYWTTAAPSQSQSTQSATTLAHPLLDRWLRSPLKSVQFESQFSSDSLPLVKHHRLDGLPVANLVIYLEMALAGAAEMGRNQVHRLEDVCISQALILPEGETRTVQLVLNPELSNRTAFQVFSLPQSESAWTLHASGHLCSEELPIASEPVTPIALETLQTQFQEISSTDFYQTMAVRGADLGKTCQALERIWRQDGVAIAQIRLDQQPSGYQLPLQAIDACFQLLSACPPPDWTDGYLLVGLERLQFYEYSGNQFWGEARLQLGDPQADSSQNLRSPETLTGDLRLVDASGALVMEVVNVQLKRLSRNTLRAAQSSKNASSTARSPHRTLSRTQLLAANPDDRPHILQTHLLTTLATSLQIPIAKLDAHQPLALLLDSLMAFELRSQIETDLRVLLPMETFFGSTNIVQLADLVLERLIIANLAPSEPAANFSEDIEEITL